MQVHTIDQIEGFRASGEEQAAATILLVPGVDNSGPQHWQSYWELMANFHRVEMPDWSQPKFHEWIPTLDRSIRESPRPVVLVAHSLGCLAVTWWASLYWSPAFSEKIAGALLVAPADVDRVDAVEAIRDFRPLPKTRLPFRSILVASRDDSYATFDRSREMARLWGSELVDAGAIGHINADSRIGQWSTGLSLLADLTGGNPHRLIAELSLRAALA